MRLTVLVLGGTSEANGLVNRLIDDPRYAVTLSLAGRTSTPRLPAIATRIGGFGGAEGLAGYLRERGVHILIDATHPFAERISANARRAANSVGTPLIVLERPTWAPEAGDTWTRVASLDEAAAALPREHARVLLTVGRQSIGPFATKPQHYYLIRVIDPPSIPEAMTDVEVLRDRGPFQVDAERSLMTEKRIDILVTKNSGGTAAHAKIAAARQLGLPVIMVDRPKPTEGRGVTSVDDVLARLAKHHSSLTKRSL
jgi:precorrin-6A/cobalt-precorrin-6A reductase